MYTIEKLKGLFASGKIGRRDFIQGAVALGATLTAATSMSSAVMASPKKRWYIKTCNEFWNNYRYS